MIVSIHQPNFVPWLGYFYKIQQSDVFVILDNVQYTKNGFVNRNRIKTPQGELWLTLPVIQSGKFGQNVMDTSIFNKSQHINKILKSLQANYGKTEFFETYIKDITILLNDANDNLCELNINIIKWILNELKISTKIVRSSELKGITGESTERLVSICEKLNATKYLAGLGAKKYQEDDLFMAKNIQVISSPFVYPEYKQLWGEFIPNLSVLDILFNCGPEVKNKLE